MHPQRRTSRIQTDLLVGVITLLLGSIIYIGGAFTLTPPAHAQTGANRQFHVTGQSITGTLASPATVEGGTLATSVNIDFIVIANKDSSAHTITIQDCTPTTPFVLFNAYSIPATTTWTIPLGNSRFVGCLQWTASSTNVWGTIVGTR